MNPNIEKAFHDYEALIAKENKPEGNHNIEYFAMDCFYLFVGCYLPAWLCEQSSAIVQRLRNHAVHGMVYALSLIHI